MSTPPSPRVTCKILQPDGCARIGALCLNDPARHNRLTPDLLADFAKALASAEAAGAQVLLIEAKGAHFCTGGDVGLFLEAARADQVLGFAQDLVGALHEILLRLVSFEGPVVTCAQGAVTGGGAGLLFAADVILLAENAFLQPYYGAVGFAPDGGWTALLPRRIGAGAAGQWLMQDTRHTAEQAAQAGLCPPPCPVEALAETGARLATALAAPVRLQTARAAKALLWPPEARASTRAALDAETAAFVRCIARPETVAAMAEFCTPEARH